MICTSSLKPKLRLLHNRRWRSIKAPKCCSASPRLKENGSTRRNCPLLQKVNLTTLIRRGEGPTLVKCETYRFRGHSLADPDELRDPAEKAHYAARDPITALKKYIFEHNLASEHEQKAIDKKIDEVLEDAVEFAYESPLPPRSQLLENVFADPIGFGIGPDGRYRCEDPLLRALPKSSLCWTYSNQLVLYLCS